MCNIKPGIPDSVFALCTLYNCVQIIIINYCYYYYYYYCYYCLNPACLWIPQVWCYAP